MPLWDESYPWAQQTGPVDPMMGFQAPVKQKPGLWDRIQTGLLGPAQSYGGLLSAEDQRAARQQGLMAMASQLMAAGGPSQTPVSLGQALSQGMQAGQQGQRQSIDDRLQAMLVATQLQKKQQKKPIAVIGQDGNPVYIDEQEAIGKQPYSPVQRAEAPAVIQEYNLYTEQAKAAGKAPLPYMDWLSERAKTNVGAPYVVGDLAGGRALFNRTNPADVRQLSTAAQEAQGASQIKAGEAAGQVQGQTQATAQSDLPRVLDNAQQGLDAIEKLKVHPGLHYITGAYSLAPVMPGTSQADADALAQQIQGKTFLEAYNSLKGGGQITEVEGKKAEDAIARLQRHQSKREYVQALNDLEGVIKQGVSRARTKAGQAAPASSVTRVKVDAEGNVIGN